MRLTLSYYWKDDESGKIHTWCPLKLQILHSLARVTVIVLMIKETVTNLLLQTLTESFELYILLITNPLPLHLQLLLLLLLAHVVLQLLLLLCKSLKGYLCTLQSQGQYNVHTPPIQVLRHLTATSEERFSLHINLTLNMSYSGSFFFFTHICSTVSPHFPHPPTQSAPEKITDKGTGV